MRPTPAEELGALHRILESVIAPALEDDYLRTQLRHVTDTMARLTADWNRALPDLRSENEEMESFLAEFSLPDSTTVTHYEAEGDLGFDQVNERHQYLRGLLVTLVQGLEQSEENIAALEARRKIHTFLVASSERWIG